MTTRTFTAEVDVDLDEWDDDDIREECERRGIKVSSDFSGVEPEDLTRWADLLRAGKDELVMNEFRTVLRDYLGLAFL